MENFSGTSNTESNISYWNKALLHSNQLSDSELLEWYNYLNQKIEKINEVFRKNVMGSLTEDELSNALSY